MEDNALMIFVKNPELGKVKTRLAADLGDATALEIYLALLDHTRRTSLSIQARRYTFYASYVDNMDEWDSRFFAKKLQNGISLGQRMKNAFDEILCSHRKGVLIGSDCPGITPDLLELANELLEHTDVVLGPAMDGGYYLLGMKKTHAHLFTKMPWSTEKVLPETRQRLKDAGLRWDELPVLADIDKAEDWQRWGFPLPTQDEGQW